jgi:hypothetical protein
MEQVKKYTSQRAVYLAASHCSHPELDATDTLLLVYLALNGDFGTGKNSHPGNLNIRHALKLTDSPTDARLKKNIERGLIERTARADGRGKASTYRLCLESPYYPEQTPGGESLTDKPPCLDGAVKEYKPPCLDGAVVSETALSDDGNRPVKVPKPPCPDRPPPRTTRRTPHPHHKPRQPKRMS